MSKVERSYTDDLMAELNRLPPPRLVLKHNDRSTGGIADVSCSVWKASYWIEVKHTRKGERLRSVIDMKQIITGIEMWEATDGRSVIVNYEEATETTALWCPWKALHEWRSTEPMTVELLPSGVLVNFVEQLRTRGIIRVRGFDHQAVVRWMQDFG